MLQIARAYTRSKKLPMYNNRNVIFKFQTTTIIYRNSIHTTGDKNTCWTLVFLYFILFFYSSSCVFFSLINFYFNATTTFTIFMLHDRLIKVSYFRQCLAYMYSVRVQIGTAMQWKMQEICLITLRTHAYKNWKNKNKKRFCNMRYSTMCSGYLNCAHNEKEITLRQLSNGEKKTSQVYK